MRKTFVKLVSIACMLLILQGCGFTSLFRGGNDANMNARESALNALVTTTNSAVLVMTGLGIAYDLGAFGAPGSQKAEEMWGRISAESIRLSTALTAWSEALKANKDSSAAEALVSQALAVLGALMPPRVGSGGGMASLLPSRERVMFGLGNLADPDSFRTRSLVMAGGY